MNNTKQDSPFNVSVVIPAYNIGKLVARAIDSVLAQTHQPDEIIVVDDGSTDDTASVIKSYGSKVHYIYQDNLGLAGARNTGIRAANCEWVAFLDGDDEWLDNNLKLQLQLLKQNPHLVWSMGNFDTFLESEDSRQPYITLEKAYKLLAGKDYFDDFFDAYRRDLPRHSNTVIIKRVILQRAGLFRQKLRYAEDMDMWFRMAIHWPQVGFVAESIAVYYVQRPGSLIDHTKSVKKMKVLCGIISNSMKLAREHNRTKKFEPCARLLLRKSIRSSLFEYHMAATVRETINRFNYLLPPAYKIFIRLLTQFPRTTATIMHTISRIVRSLNLRRRVVRLPRRSR